MLIGNIDLYLNIKPVIANLSASIKDYYISLSRQDLQLIANSLSEIRIQSKESLKSLRYVNDTLSINADNQNKALLSNVYNVTLKLERLSNQILVKVQNIFISESTTGSGFRMTSEVCLSSSFCFPPLKVEVLNSNSRCSKYTELYKIDSNTCITGEYTTNEYLNSLISIPVGSQFSLALQTDRNNWLGNLPILINILGIEQVTMMELTITQTRFKFSGKLWGLFDMEGVATSELESFESMVLQVNGNVAVEGPLTLGRIIKNKIIKLSDKSVADSERRLNQGNKAVELAKAKLHEVLEEEAVKKVTFDNIKIKYAAAEEDLHAANINVERARLRLEDVRNYTQEVTDKLDEVCEIFECEGVCVPGSKIVAVTEDVYGDVPYQCCDRRTESAVVQGTTICCNECRYATAVKKGSWLSRAITLVIGIYHAYSGNWFSAAGSLIRFLTAPRGYRLSYTTGPCCTECKEPVEIKVEFESCSTCVERQIIGQVERLDTEEVACSVRLPDSNCVRKNEQCRRTRSRLFDRLKEAIPGLAEPIEELDNAVLQASIKQATLNKVFIELNDVLDQHQEVLYRLTALQTYFNNTENALQNIIQDVQAGLVIKQHQINGSLEDSLEFKELTFNIDLVGEDTTVIPIVCIMTLSTIPVQIQFFIDVNNLNNTVKNAALFITEELFGEITRSVRRRRDVRQKRLGIHNRERRDSNMVIVQPPINDVIYEVVNSSSSNISSRISRDRSIVQNEARCKDYNDILSYVEHAFQTLLQVANRSKQANAQSLENEDNFQNEYLYNLSASASSDAVNNSAALLYFNLTMEDFEENNNSSERGLEQNALMEVIDSAKLRANNTKSLLNVDNVLTKWEVVMDIYTYNSSGLTDCEGFYDCLTSELIALKYLAEGRQSYDYVDALDESIFTFLDGKTLSVNEAEVSAMGILEQVSFLREHNDVCLKEPVITKHPEPEIVSVKGNDVTLTCQATGKPTPSFTWKFNGKTMSGKNSNVLLLKQVQSSDSGTYTCHASNEVTSVQSLQSKVRVEFAPLVTEPPQDEDIEYGNPEGAYFTCNAFALPFSDYRWYFQPSLSSEMKLIPGQNESGIEILTPKFNHGGWYTCEAWNKHGQYFSNPARLHVLDVSIPEFSSDISIRLYRIENSNSIIVNNSLNDVISDIIGEDDLKLKQINYKESNPSNKAFLTRISFNIKSTNYVSFDILNRSREELAYNVHNKMELIRTKIVQLENAFTPGEIFEHRGEVLEVTKFVSGMNGPICPNTQFAHHDGYVCVNCPPGSYRGNDELPAICQPCPRGYYQPLEGQTGCLKCDGDSGPEPGSRTCIVIPLDDSTTTIPEVKPTGEELDTDILVYIIGGASGGLICLLLGIVFIVLYVTKRNTTKQEYDVDKKDLDEAEKSSGIGLDNPQIVNVYSTSTEYKYLKRNSGENPIKIDKI